MLNFTPHPITLPPSGAVAWVTMDETVAGTDALTGLPIIHRKPVELAIEETA